MKMTSRILSLIIGTVCVLSSANAAPLRDLSPFQTVKLDVNLRVVDIGERTPDVFYEVANNFTNSIVCTVDAAIPVTKDGAEGVFEVSQSDVVVFPDSAFPSRLSYKIDESRVPADRTVQLGATVKLDGAATCSGWNLGRRLPRRTCLVLNPNHDQICVNVRAAGKDFYPVVQGRDAHLGDCGC